MLQNLRNTYSVHRECLISMSPHIHSHPRNTACKKYKYQIKRNPHSPLLSIAQISLCICLVIEYIFVWFNNKSNTGSLGALLELSSQTEARRAVPLMGLKCRRTESPNGLSDVQILTWFDFLVVHKNHNIWGEKKNFQQKTFLSCCLLNLFPHAFTNPVEVLLKISD